MKNKKGFKNLLGKMLLNIHTKKKSIIKSVERIDKNFIRIWLDSGSWLSKKEAIQDYQIYLRGWKNLKNYLV